MIKLSRFASVAAGLAVAVLAVVSCAREEFARPSAEKAELVPMQFTVGGELPSSDAAVRSALGTDGAVTFNAGDKIGIFSGGKEYEFTTEAGGASAVFSGEAPGAETWYALYPYYAEGSHSSIGTYPFSDKNVVTVVFPHEQKGVAGSFDPAANISIGKSATTTLQMKNLCGLLSVDIKSSDITEIVAISRNGLDKIAGLLRVKVEEDGTPVFVSSWSPALDTATPGVVENQDGYAIFFTPKEGETFAPGRYYICVPATTLSSGIRLRITNNKSEMAEIVGEKECVIERAKILDLGEIDSSKLKWNYALKLPMIKCSYPLPSRAANWQFMEPTGTFSSSISTPKEGTAGVRFELNSLAGDKYYYYASTGIAPTHGRQGFRFGDKPGDYFEFPALPGRKLVRVEIHAGTCKAAVRICKTDGTLAAGGDEKKPVGFHCMMEWNLADTQPGEAYRMVLGEQREDTDGNWCEMTDIVLFYETTVSGPTIFGVDETLSAIEDRTATNYNYEVTVNGLFSHAGEASMSEYKVGVEYREEGAAEWTALEAKATGGLISASVGGLEMLKFYDFRTWASIGDGEKTYSKIHKIGYVGMFSNNNADQSAKIAPGWPIFGGLKSQSGAMTTWIHERSANFSGTYPFSVRSQYGLRFISAESTGLSLGINFTDAGGANAWKEGGPDVWAYYSLPGVPGFKLTSARYAHYASNTAYRATTQNMNVICKGVTVTGEGTATVATPTDVVGNVPSAYVSDKFKYLKKPAADGSRASAEIVIWVFTAKIDEPETGVGYYIFGNHIGYLGLRWIYLNYVAE